MSAAYFGSVNANLKPPRGCKPGARNGGRGPQTMPFVGRYEDAREIYLIILLREREDTQE